MKKERKIREPYPPEHTPKPPQIIDPDVRGERDDPSAEKDGGAPTGNEEKKEKQGLLNERADINDETTI